MDRRSFLLGAIAASVVPSAALGAASVRLRPEPKSFFISQTTLEELDSVWAYEENEEHGARLNKCAPDVWDFLAYEYRQFTEHSVIVRLENPFLESTRDGWRRWVHEQGFDTITFVQLHDADAYRVEFSRRI